RGLPQVLRVLARGRARGVDVVLHRRSVRARRRRRPRRVGVGIRRLRSDPSETADDGHRRRVRPGGKPGDDLVPGAIDAACVGPELGEPILADLHRPKPAGHDPISGPVGPGRREDLTARRTPDGGGAGGSPGAAAGERRPRTRAARRPGARGRARRRRLAPAAEHARTERLVIDRRSVHPMAWIAWATSAGFVAFLTTDPVYLLL